MKKKVKKKKYFFAKDVIKGTQRESQSLAMVCITTFLNAISALFCGDWRAFLQLKIQLSVFLNYFTSFLIPHRI